ncbi:helix-turn-helix domain-containing protein [Streptomyces sp. NRRL S-340]|uniref:helix-turn-helix domain-containing protein n=1 Tax=Streptomyces sp. NRRL S-340 TaxID=1463901 RepID=UPI0005641A3F|nr:XRE family transcriptional regulator [Streptomyces sp. NRRL S-340]
MTDTAPPSAKPVCVRLAKELRVLRTRTGLSMATLAERTKYSKSSWERYLNGKQLAPRQAVEALCTMAQEPPGRLLALWELADLEWSGRAHRTVPPTAERAATSSHGNRPSDPRTSPDHATPGPARRGGIQRHRRAFAAACMVGITAAIGVAALLRTTAEKPPQSASSAPAAPGCHARTCAGHQPTAMGCAMPSQEKILRGQQISPGVRLEVVYSTQCRAAWAVVGSAHVGDTLIVSVPGRAPQQAEVSDKYDAEGPLITPMTDGSDLTGLQACYKPAGGHNECFLR